MNLFYYELIKLIKRKSFWILFLAICFANLVFINVEKNVQDSSGYNQKYYEEIYTILETMSIDEANTWLLNENEYYTHIENYKMSLLFPDFIETILLSNEELNRYKKYEDDTYYWIERRDVINEFSSYYQKLLKYPTYLESIKENLYSIKNNPLWNHMNDYEKEDVLQQGESYAVLEDLSLKPILYRSIQSFANAMPLRLLSLVMVCFFAILIIKEDEENMHELLKSCLHGHKSTMLVKITVFIVVALFSVLLLQGLDLLWRCFVFGGFDGNAPIQCVPSFYECSYVLTINEWICISMIVFACMILMLGLCFMFCYHLFQNKILSFLLYFSFFLIEAVLYSMISPQSKWIVLSHINILRLFEGTFIGLFLSDYRILSLRISAQLFIIVVCLLLGFISSMMYVKFYDYKWKGKQYTVPTLVLKNTYIKLQEGFRILYINKGLSIILISILISIISFVYRYSTYENLREEQKYVYQIYEKYEGEITEDTKSRIELRMQTYANAEQDYQKSIVSYQNNELSYDDLMQEQINYTVRMKDESIYQKLYSYLDMPYDFITYNEGFSSIFSLKSLDKDNGQSIFMIISLLLFISGISTKKEEEELYLTTYKGGNKRHHAMWFQVFCFGLLISFIIEMCSFLHYYTLYPMGDYNVSMNQLLMLDGQMPITHLATINAGQYLLLLFGTKLFGILSICIISTFLFRYSKNRIIGLFIVFSFFFIPMFLYYNGFTFISSISIFDFIMGNLFLQKTYSILKVIMLLIIDLICIYLVKKSYCKW